MDDKIQKGIARWLADQGDGYNPNATYRTAYRGNGRYEVYSYTGKDSRPNRVGLYDVNSKTGRIAAVGNKGKSISMSFKEAEQFGNYDHYESRFTDNNPDYSSYPALTTRTGVNNDIKTRLIEQNKGKNDDYIQLDGTRFLIYDGNSLKPKTIIDIGQGNARHDAFKTPSDRIVIKDVSNLNYNITDFDDPKKLDKAMNIRSKALVTDSYDMLRYKDKMYTLDSKDAKPVSNLLPLHANSLPHNDSNRNYGQEIKHEFGKPLMDVRGFDETVDYQEGRQNLDSYFHNRYYEKYSDAEETEKYGTPVRNLPEPIRNEIIDRGPEPIQGTRVPVGEPIHIPDSRRKELGYAPNMRWEEPIKKQINENKTNQMIESSKEELRSKNPFLKNVFRSGGYTPGQQIKYRSGGVIKTGVVKRYNPYNNELELY